MEELSMCRVCLARDVGMRFIANTHLQEVYEGLTLMPLETKDNRPTRVCYICCAALQNCYWLRQRCQQTEELLTHHVLKLVNIQECSRAQRITVVHPVIALSIDGEVQSETDDDTTGHWDYLTETAQVVDNVKEDKKDTQYIEIKLEDCMLEENAAGPSSQSPENPKIHKKAFGHVILNDTGIGTSVVKKHHLATQKDSSATTYTDLRIKTEIAERENVDKNSFKGKPFPLSQINKTIDKIDVTSLKHKNKLTFTNDGNRKRTSKSNIEEGIIIKSRSKCNTRKQTDEKLFHCNLCKKSYVTKYFLTKHMHKHTVKMRYTCDVCDQSYLYKTSLVRHMCKHKDVGQYKCHVCKKRFLQKDNFKTHICIKSDRRIMCKICNKCIMSCYFKNHMSVHTGDKRYMCDVCSKCFIQQTSLKRHMRTHTGEKPYECNVCNKCFPEKDKLGKHMRTHTGEKPYICSVCKKCFNSIFHLKRHRLLHSGEKPFVCEECGKGFTQKSNLRSHTRTHTGEKPYSCDECKICFTNNSSLKTHILRHNEKK